jgi:hypothetical protein
LIASRRPIADRHPRLGAIHSHEDRLGGSRRGRTSWPRNGKRRGDPHPRRNLIGFSGRRRQAYPAFSLPPYFFEKARSRQSRPLSATRQTMTKDSTSPSARQAAGRNRRYVHPTKLQRVAPAMASEIPLTAPMILARIIVEGIIVAVGTVDVRIRVAIGMVMLPYSGLRGDAER